MSVLDAFKRDMQSFSGINDFKNLISDPSRDQKSGLERIKDNFRTILGDALSLGLDRKVKKNFDEGARAYRELFANEIARANAEAASQDAEAAKFDAQFASGTQNKGI